MSMCSLTVYAYMSMCTLTVYAYMSVCQGFHLEEGGGNFPLLLRHVSPATFDKFV